MYKIIITNDAQRNIDQIVYGLIEYSFSVESGLRLLNDIYAKIELIGAMPEGIGRLRDDGKRREAFCRGYRIVYRIEHQNVYILAVIHSRMLYPRPS